MNRPTKALFVAAMAAAPVGSSWGTAHASPLGATSKKFKGPVVDMRWGPVQATIAVKNRKIVGVSIATSPENFRSQFIDDQAVPLLKEETLQAQSAKIDEISGATMTSDAYIESLQSAVKKARHQKALK